ncbi:hypothetical protein SMY29_004396 [Cronobacter sakazakii]|nr:hypothetical protein [Cronobacter sakazakii]ELY3990295.1 hypothetical protein [Cronobacter sakazakii]ELY4761570.1 hypothetical protein [Cronobacter sakazakii]
MIKFLNSIYSADPKKFLNGTVSDFWDILNPRKNDGELYEYSLCNRLSNLISQYEQGNHLNNAASGCKKTQKRHIKYLKRLEYNNYKKLKELITSDSQYLPIRIRETFNLLEPDDISQLINGRWQATKLGKLLLSEVFCYDTFRTSTKCVEFYKKTHIGRMHCLYCGIYDLKTISIVKPTEENEFKDENGKMLFDLDHFYLKSQYPFLALSFFNLVPCCGICNSRIRGTKEFDHTTHINPYEDSFDTHYKFEFNEIEIVAATVIGTAHIKSLDIVRHPNSTRTTDKTAADFQLIARYREYTSDLDLFLENIINNRDRSLSEIEATLYKQSEKLPKNRNEIPYYSKGKFYLDFWDKVKPNLLKRAP